MLKSKNPISVNGGMRMRRYSIFHLVPIFEKLLPQGIPFYPVRNNAALLCSGVRFWNKSGWV
jgi:hypothetical protein